MAHIPRLVLFLCFLFLLSPTLSFISHYAYVLLWGLSLLYLFPVIAQLPSNCACYLTALEFPLRSSRERVFLCLPCWMLLYIYVVLLLELLCYLVLCSFSSSFFRNPTLVQICKYHIPTS
jgi:hypothetical protein